MASTEEKLLTLLLSVEHLQHTAMEQQKAVADSLAVARETLRGYRFLQCLKSGAACWTASA